MQQLLQSKWHHTCSIFQTNYYYSVTRVFSQCYKEKERELLLLLPLQIETITFRRTLPRTGHLKCRQTSNWWWTHYEGSPFSHSLCLPLRGHVKNANWLRFTDDYLLLISAALVAARALRALLKKKCAGGGGVETNTEREKERERRGEMPICRSSLGIIIISISFHLVVVVVGGLVCSCSSASSEMKSKKKKRREKRTSLTWRCALRVSLDAGGDSGSHHPLTIACGCMCVWLPPQLDTVNHTHTHAQPKRVVLVGSYTASDDDAISGWRSSGESVSMYQCSKVYVCDCRWLCKLWGWRNPEDCCDDAQGERKRENTVCQWREGKKDRRRRFRRRRRMHIRLDQTYVTPCQCLTDRRSHFLFLFLPFLLSTVVLCLTHLQMLQLLMER